MAMDPELRALLTQVVQVRPRTGLDDAGDPTYGDLLPVRCIIEQDERLVRTPDGFQFRMQAMVVAESFADTDRLWLPGENPGSDEGHPIIQTRSQVDPETGEQVYVEVYL